MPTKRTFREEKNFKFKLAFFIFTGIILFLPFLKTQASTLWQTAGLKNKGFASAGAGNETDITTSNLGTVYIAFQDKKSGSKVRVRKLNGDEWVDLADSNSPGGIVSSQEGYKPSVVAKEDEVYVTFSDQSENNRIRVKKWNGSTWNDLSDSLHPLGLISSQKGEEPEIMFNKSGNFLYVAFRDEASGNRIKFLKWNKSQWEEVSDENNPGGFASPGAGTEVAIAASKIDDSMYLTYEDVSNNLRLKVRKFDGSHWTDITDSAHPDGLITKMPAYSPSLDVDSQDRLYIVYTYKREGNTYVLYWNGSNWGSLGNGIAARGKTIESTIGVDGNNNVLVAMSQYKKVGKRKISWGIRVKKWSDNSWKDVSDSKHKQGFLSKKGKGDPAFAFFSGKTYISFTDCGFSKKARVMFY